MYAKKHTHTHNIHAHASIIVKKVFTTLRAETLNAFYATEDSNETAVVAAISTQDKRPDQTPHEYQEETAEEASVTTVIPFPTIVLTIPSPVRLPVEAAVADVLGMATTFVFVPPTVGVVHVDGAMTTA